jgi:hypothetical protein
MGYPPTPDGAGTAKATSDPHNMQEPSGRAGWAGSHSTDAAAGGPYYTRRNRLSDSPDPSEDTATAAPSSTATSALNGIVRGAAIRVQ